MLNDKVGSVLVRDNPAKAGLDLTRDVEVVENGQTAFVELHHTEPLRSDKADIVVNFLEDVGIVDVDVLEVRVKEVAQNGHRTACFLMDKSWQLLGLLHFAENAFPTCHEDFHLGIQFASSLAFGHRTDDDAAVLGLDALYNLLQASPLGTTLDFRGDGNLVAKRREDKETSGEREVATQSRTFRRDGLLDDLHKHLLSLLQISLHAAVLGQFWQHGSLLEGVKVLAVALHLLEILGIGRELQTEVEVVEEGIVLVTDAYEAGIQSGHELPDLRQIHVAHGEGNTLFLLLILSQPLVLGQGNGDFFRLYVDVKFACYVHSFLQKKVTEL